MSEGKKVQQQQQQQQQPAEAIEKRKSATPADLLTVFITRMMPHHI